MRGRAGVVAACRPRKAVTVAAKAIFLHRLRQVQFSDSLTENVAEIVRPSFGTLTKLRMEA